MTFLLAEVGCARYSYSSVKVFQSLQGIEAARAAAPLALLLLLLIARPTYQTHRPGGFITRGRVDYNYQDQIVPESA